MDSIYLIISGFSGGIEGLKTIDYDPGRPLAGAVKLRMATAAAGGGVLVMILPAMLGQFGVQAATPAACGSTAGRGAYA